MNGMFINAASGDLLTLEHSFPVTVKQVYKTSILKDASLESRLGEEFAFGT